jgi:hypothetical protein
LRRAPGRRNLIYKLADYKKVMVRIADPSVKAVAASPTPAATAATTAAKELR